jgi:hypothetical protein
MGHIEATQDRQGDPHEKRGKNQEQRASQEGEDLVCPEMMKKMVVRHGIDWSGHFCEKGYQQSVNANGYFYLTV